MTREEAIKIAYDMGAHPYSIESMVACLIKGAEIGATEQKAIDMEGFKNLVKKEFDSLYELYIRKAGCKSEYSRTVAPSQMDAIDTLKNAILEVMEE